MVQQKEIKPDGSGKQGNSCGWKKRLIKIAAVLLVLVFVTVLGLGLLVKSFVTKEWLIEQIEQEINSEVLIGEMAISVLSIPANITLREVELRAKGEELTDKAPVQIGELSLSLGLWELLHKNINVTNITIRDAKITNVYHEDGTTSLQKLFDSPGNKKRKQAHKDKVKQEGFNAHEHEEIVTTLGGLNIENARLELILEGMGMELVCDDLDIELSAIKVDPKQLSAVNDAKLKMSAHVRINSSKGEHYGDLYMDGVSDVLIFNPDTGEVEPEVRGEFNLADESWLSAQIPVITRAWDSLSVLRKVGIKVAALPSKATFGRSQSISAHYHQGEIAVEKPLSIWLGDWEFAVLEGGWIDTKTDQHRARGELLASQGASKTMKSLIFGVVGMLPQKIRETVAEDVERDMFRDERLLVKIKSSGYFSDPKVRTDGKVVDVSESAKEELKEIYKQKAEDLLEGLLK